MPREKALFPVATPSASNYLSAAAYNMSASIITPVTDMDISAIYVAVGGTNFSGRPYIFNETTKALVSTGPLVPTGSYSAGNWTKMPLDAPIKLLKNQPYMVGFYATTNYNAGLFDFAGTYTIEEGPGMILTPPYDVRYTGGTGYPANGAGFAKYLAIGFSVLLPLDPVFEIVSGYTTEATEPLAINYKITDLDGAAVKVVIKVGSSIVLTDNAPAHNVTKGFSLASLWPALPYGSNVLIVELTNVFGNVKVTKLPFSKLLSANTPLIESASRLQQAADNLKVDIAAVVALAGKPAGTKLADAIPGLGTWKYAAGLSYPSTTTVAGTRPTGATVNGYRYIEASGLPFRPKLVKLSVQQTNDVRSVHVIIMTDTPAPITGNMGTAQVFAAHYYETTTGVNSDAFRLDTTLNFFTENGFRIFAAGTATAIQYKWEAWG